MRDQNRWARIYLFYINISVESEVKDSSGSIVCVKDESNIDFDLPQEL